ncbi:6883_t:CDS:2, partial [Acaulospora colombiana]
MRSDQAFTTPSYSIGEWRNYVEGVASVCLLGMREAMREDRGRWPIEWQDLSVRASSAPPSARKRRVAVTESRRRSKSSRDSRNASSRDFKPDNKRCVCGFPDLYHNGVAHQRHLDLLTNKRLREKTERAEKGWRDHHSNGRANQMFDFTKPLVNSVAHL